MPPFAPRLIAAAVGLGAEALAIAHGDDGVRVSVVCPQYVATAMIGCASEDAAAATAVGGVDAGGDGVLSPDAVARCVLDGVEAGDFCILPHVGVARYAQLKTADYGRWISGMRKLRRLQQGAQAEARAARGAS